MVVIMMLTKEERGLHHEDTDKEDFEDRVADS